MTEARAPAANRRHRLRTARCTYTYSYPRAALRKGRDGLPGRRDGPSFGPTGRIATGLVPMPLETGTAEPSRIDLLSKLGHRKAPWETRDGQGQDRSRANRSAENPTRPPQVREVERSDSGDAFFPDPEDGPALAPDDLAETLAEDYLQSATSGSDVDDEVLNQVVPEEIGRPLRRDIPERGVRRGDGRIESRGRRGRRAPPRGERGGGETSDSRASPGLTGQGRRR